MVCSDGFVLMLSIKNVMSNYFKTTPNAAGEFGEFGGSFLPPHLQEEMDKITEAYYSISKSHAFISELRSIRKHFQGRPTPVYFLPAAVG